MFLVCGEALFDLFQAEASSGPVLTLEARAGGSPFNVAIGLARQGRAVGLLTGLSGDALGRRLAGILAAEGVAMDHVVATDRPTTLALVALDGAGVPDYRFYGQGGADTGLAPGDLPPIAAAVSGFHVGSYSLVVAPVADAMAALIRGTGARFVSIDPNVRPTVEPDMGVWRRRLDALWGQAQLVKISTEDLGLLAPGTDAGTFAAYLMDRGVGLVVVTDGPRPARAWAASGLRAEAVPPSVPVIDTVGAGDSFQATLLAGLLEDGDPRAALAGLTRERLAALLARAARAAAIACSRRGADLPRGAELAEV